MKRNIILILVVLLGLSWYTAVSETINNPKKKEAHLEKADKLEKKGIYVDAVMEYEEALKYDETGKCIFAKRRQREICVCLPAGSGDISGR